ncbi:tetratricopeptide repeat protein [Pusillimonas sp. T7-7]|uniref:tetratricopeptide repeat protein n=1 Tax=Pusillimonas sp. (strain T7-7) TaxID=1007105 RepID=UPI0011D2A925|nr:tetratricopeptide repeat protein [Pusillimonas sp. T7-7]
MFRISCPALMIALFAGGLSIQVARAQTPVPGLVPHVDLNASLDAGPGQHKASDIAAGLLVVVPRGQKADSGGKLFSDPPAEEKGWKGLARLLEALTPSIDTDLPLSASQITDRISSMLDQGQNQEALQVIEKRMAQLEARGGMGADVQLLFLRGRALAAVGRNTEAISTYQNMTTLYPELPEPWNNLAAEYVKQGKLDMAYDALQMSLSANPNYATAKENLGEVQLMLAQRSFQEASRLGAGQAQAKAQQTRDILSQ